ncbi:hypothetical protein R1T08_06905 [Streptomyces sp. SBC-4]|nr:hypothetical protein [Streptomyces sp. SBC-4]MDV5143999.1 hypothetical protein [Streptomyces sp. SBC-4]
MKFRRQMARVVTPVVGSLALLATGMATAPVEAQAAALGRVCMFEAPDGAYGAGHAAFAIKVRGKANHWIYGSFGSYVDAPRNGWIKGGTWEKARAHFTSVKDKNQQYYTRYRCVNTRDGDVKRAQSWYTTVKNRGYILSTNNCLHMSMAVFKGYSEILRKDTRLPSATNKTPDYYYETVLKKAKWEMSHRLDDVKKK